MKIIEKPLIGREWLQQLQLLHFNIYHIKTDVKDQKFYTKNTIILLQARLRLQPGAMFVFMKAHGVHFKLPLPSVDKEIDRLVNVGLLEKVNSSDWATPIVPVPKSNNKFGKSH